MKRNMKVKDVAPKHGEPYGVGRLQAKFLAQEKAVFLLDGGCWANNIISHIKTNMAASDGLDLQRYQYND
jgi:hypothetical protein